MALPKKIHLEERRLGRKKALGLAHFGEDRIEVDPRQPYKELLDTTIHEGIHLLFPELPERKVISVSRRLKRLLWKSGWRRIYMP